MAFIAVQIHSSVGRVSIHTNNPGAAAIFGYGSDEMLGRPFDAICAAGGDAAFSLGNVHDLSASLLMPSKSVTAARAPISVSMRCCGVQKSLA